MSMTKSSALREARDDANFTAQDLRLALSQASAVEALILLPMIKQAHELETQIRALISATQEEDK